MLSDKFWESAIRQKFPHSDGLSAIKTRSWWSVQKKSGGIYDPWEDKAPVARNSEDKGDGDYAFIITSQNSNCGTFLVTNAALAGVNFDHAVRRLAYWIAVSGKRHYIYFTASEKTVDGGYNFKRGIELLKDIGFEIKYEFFNSGYPGRADKGKSYVMALDVEPDAQKKLKKITEEESEAAYLQATKPLKKAA